MKANFFLVGAPKAGTTSVDRLLRTHPDVFLSPIKEPCHFCPDVNAQIASGKNARRNFDVATYLASPERRIVHLGEVASARDYSRLFEGASGHRIVGECSTYYLSSQSAPEHIRAYNPEARILVLVRNPVDRIRSHYAMDRSLGLASRSLLTLIEEELALGEGANWGNCRFYVGASRYSRQIERYRSCFAPEHICVLSFENMIAQPDRELARLFAFLDIDAPSGRLALPLENKSRAARFPRLHGGLRHSGLKPLIAGLLGDRIGSGLGKAAKSLYYRERAQVVSEEELDRIGILLREEGLDFAMADAA